MKISIFIEGFQYHSSGWPLFFHYIIPIFLYITRITRRWKNIRSRPKEEARKKYAPGDIDFHTSALQHIPHNAIIYN